MIRTNNPYAALPYYYVVRGGRVEGISSLTASTTSGNLSTMKRRKHKKKLDLGPSQVAVNSFKGKGGVHDDQKTNHKRERKAAKRALKELDD